MKAIVLFLPHFAHAVNATLERHVPTIVAIGEWSEPVSDHDGYTLAPDSLLINKAEDDSRSQKCGDMPE